VAERKKILITLPDSLLSEVDVLANSDKQSRSELIREAMRLYVKERKRLDMIERMKKGYQLMAGINLEYAEFGFEADNQQYQCYEEKLAECE